MQLLMLIQLHLAPLLPCRSNTRMDQRSKGLLGSHTHLHTTFRLHVLFPGQGNIRVDRHEIPTPPISYFSKAIKCIACRRNQLCFLSILLH